MIINVITVINISAIVPGNVF